MLEIPHKATDTITTIINACAMLEIWLWSQAKQSGMSSKCSLLEVRDKIKASKNYTQSAKATSSKQINAMLSAKFFTVIKRS